METSDGLLEWLDVGEGEFVEVEAGGVGGGGGGGGSRRLSTGQDIVGRTCAFRLKKDIVKRREEFFRITMYTWASTRRAGRIKKQDFESLQEKNKVVKKGAVW